MTTLRNTILHQEAAKERARGLYTIPTEISTSTFLQLSSSHQTDLLTFYTLSGNQYDLYPPVSTLSAQDKFRILEDLELCNGLKLVLVHDLTDVLLLDVYFYNRNAFQQILNDPRPPRQIFPVSGGQRVLAGSAEDRVQVVQIADVDLNRAILRLTIRPVGDYSTYTLSINTVFYPKFDPLFSEIDFKFRPGCFNINCAPDWDPPSKSRANPDIDYLSKDYDSFRHTLMTAMQERVPDWEPTSEADLDQVLLDLFAASADELSDYQDRVMNESYLTTARKRVSIARHARLMDYHIHQGNQASTWMAFILDDDEVLALPKRSIFWTGTQKMDSDSVVFMSRDEKNLLFVTESTAVMTGLDAGNVHPDLNDDFAAHGIFLSTNLSVDVQIAGQKWLLKDIGNDESYCLYKIDDEVHIFLPNFHSLLNQIVLYTWSDSVPALKAGSTQADLEITQSGDEDSVKIVEKWIGEGRVTRLLIQEKLNPETGKEAGRDPTKRQILELLPGKQGAKRMYDPVSDKWLLRVSWKKEDQLKRDYCFTVFCPDGKVEDISFFNGNLARAHHGRNQQVVFEETPAVALDSSGSYYQHTEQGHSLCVLPDRYLAYQSTKPGGIIPPMSTLEVQVETSSGKDDWDEVISLIHSDNSDEMGDHFVVETDEMGYSVIRFGNGINGKLLPDQAKVHCFYQYGRGMDGNIGSDMLLYFDDTSLSEIKSCWNPLDVTDGRAPEPVAEIIRRVPEAYRYRQLRAITLKDYETRVEALEEVSQASASYAWTGSWRTVRIAVDPVGTTELQESLRKKVVQNLDAVRLIGEDLEIRAPQFVPLAIEVRVCIHPDYWVEDIRYLLEQIFSDGYTGDGRLAFFHPDRWTFGQALRKSEILGWVQEVQGVDHVSQCTMKRWHQREGKDQETIYVKSDEIILVKNDPDHMEQGMIDFKVLGGRQ